LAQGGLHLAQNIVHRTAWGRKGNDSDGPFRVLGLGGSLKRKQQGHHCHGQKGFDFFHMNIFVVAIERVCGPVALVMKAV
jgi:hypothetical protein